MTAHQTKFFKLKEVSFPILLWIVGVSVALVLHVFGVFSHAKPIENEDKVTVDGVENVVQYLTSLVLHAPWTSSQLITIQYDGGIDALRVNGRVNADALVIDAGQVNNNSSVEGNAVFWWMGNRVDGQTSNNLIVGWENNTINFARLNGAIPGRFWVSQGGGSVVIGSAKSEIRTSDNVLNIGTTNSSFSNKTRNVAAIGWQVVAQDVENSVAFWAGKKTLASNSILLGKSINAGGKNQIFVWSDSDEEFAPEHSNAFYVNAANGFGLNTTAPRTKLDLGNVGVLKIAKTEPKNCSQSSAGVTSYAGSVFCGCDGKEWIPLTSDMTPEKVAACKTLGKVKCIGTINTDSNATNMWESSAYSRWNHESDKREPMGWKYSSRDKLGACEYNCKIWFHPGANDPEGWLQVWACKACSEVVNKFRWKTAGTGNDNCDFTCKASFKYTNSSTQRTCSDCEVGTYTENDNQDKVCKNCNAPERLSTGAISPAFWTHYYTFDTKGTGKNACDFTCDARYAYFFNGKGKHDSRDSLSADLGSQALDLGISVGRGEGWKGGIGANPLPGQGTPLIKKDWVKMWTSFFPVSYNACVYCKVGTWSAGWKSKECTNCTNKQKNIDYWVDNVKGTLSDFSTYIGNGSANDCDWKCDANKGLEKHGDICKCRANTHLEWGTCIANTSNGQCNLRRQPSGNWVKIWATTYSRIWNPDLDNPNYKGTWSAPATKSWVYVENATSLSPCQWSCATGYEPSDNTCVKKAVPVKGACAQNVTVPIDGTKLVDYAQTNSSLFCSPGTLSNPRILDGKLEWDCKGLNGWASETCRVSCPANYTLLNGACVKVVEQKNCSVEIKDLSCKEARGNGWWVDRSLSYTYTWKDCRFSAIYDSWTPTEKWNLVASHNSPSGDSHIVNSDGSITATRKLNNDQIGPWYWPDTHTFYVDMWGNTSSKKSFSMYGYARKCRNALPQTPKTPIKIDWNGKPFEWEKYTIYIEGPKGTPVKIGNLNNIMERWPNWECSSIPVTRDYWIAIGNCVVSDVGVTWNPWPRLYLPYHSNSWVKFKLENWTSGKIIEANYYIWNLLGEWK